MPFYGKVPQSSVDPTEPFPFEPAEMDLVAFAHGQMGHVVIGDLDTCPWCGAPAQVIFDDLCGATDPAPDMIICGGKECAMRPMLWFADFPTSEAAVEAWNTRRGETAAKLDALGLVSTPDRSGEAGETAKHGSTEGESGLPEGSST